MTIANVSLTNTFDQWRVTTNQLIFLSNELDVRSNSGYIVANQSFNVTNAAFAVANTVFNAVVGTGSNTIISVVFDTANAAYNFANAAIVNVNDESASAQTYYVTFSTSNTGNISQLNVSSVGLTFIPSTGTLSATIFNSLSDISMKENIQPITNAMDVINRLNGVGFKWKDSGKQSFGVIAQDIESVVPELVGDVNGRKTVNYDGIIAFLIEAIHDLNKKLEEKQ